MNPPSRSRDRISIWLAIVLVLASIAIYLPRLAIAIGPGALLDAYVQAKMAAGPPVQTAVAPSGADGLGLVDPTTGIWHLRTRAGDPAVFYYGNPGDYPMMGDWDCNGTDTPGLYRQSDGFVYLRNSNTQGVADIRFFFGNPGDIPLAGDFNGNGCDTVSIYRQSEGRVHVINELGSNEGGLGYADYSYYFGNPGDKPFVGDFNGNGTDTVGLHRESTGLVYFRNTNTQGNAEFQFFFGDPGDRLVAGDWTGDNRATPALFRPSNRTMYLRYTNTQGVSDEAFTWGNNPYIPVAGNFGNLDSTITMSVSGAPQGLSYAMESFYNEYGSAPHIPLGLRSTLSGLHDGPSAPRVLGGGAAVDTAYGKQVAVITVSHPGIGADILLAVSDNGWEWRLVGAEPNSVGRDRWFGGTTRHVALIGTDWQQNEGGGWPSHPNITNADSVHILSLRPRDGSGVLTGIPRDTLFGTWFGTVKIANTSTERGVHETVQALRNESGFPIEGYFHTGFGTGVGGGNPPPGFMDLVDAFGGFNFHIPYVVAGGFVAPGDQHLNGAEALAFARERTTPPHGDVDRTLGQGLLIKAAIAEIRKGSVHTIPALLALMDGYVNTDLSIDQILTFAAATYLTNPGAMPTLTAEDLVLAGHAGTNPPYSSSHAPYQKNQGGLPNVVIKGCFLAPSSWDLVAGNYGTFSDLADAHLSQNPPYLCP